MENENPPVKYVNKSIYEDVFSTRFIVPSDQFRHNNNKSPVADCLKLPADLIAKNLNTIKNSSSNVSRVTMQITVTAILEVTEKQNA